MEETQEVHEELAEILDTKEDLNGEPKPDLNSSEKVEEETEPKVEAEEPKAEAEVEEEVTTTPEPEKEADGHYKGMMAERAKRQDLERQLAQMQATSQQPAKPPEVDIYGNPEDVGKSISELVQQAATEATRTALMQNKMETSEAAMVERLGIEEATNYVTEFKILAHDNPALMQSVQASSDPGKFVEKQVEASRTMKEISEDPVAYKARLIAEAKAEALAELKAGTVTTEPVAQRKPLPKTIANQGTAAPKTDEVVDDSLAALLGEA